MDVILSAEDIDLLDCDVFITGFFEDERPLRGSAGWIDWRLNGNLSRFLKEGRLTGEWKETTLIPSEGRMSPRMILLIGLGMVRDYSYLRLREIASHMTENAERMQASRIGVSFPYGKGYNVEGGKVAEVLIEGIVDCPEKDGGWKQRLCLLFPLNQKAFSETLLGIEIARSILKEKHTIRMSIPLEEGRR